MRTQNKCCDSAPAALRLIVERRNRAVLAVLLYLIGLLPLHALAQPLAQGKDKFLGCATSSDLFRNLNQYWNQVTPGNDGKWGSVSFGRGQYNWTNLDKIYNYAMSLGLLYKHHVLVWGNQQPAWIAGLDSANQRAEVENWIRLVGQRYPKMTFVDVVNEPFHTPLPAYKNALGGDGKTGWDWVITAFQLARQYCAPGVKLILNEYNVLHSNTVTTDYLAMINLLKDRGLIDGIGVQGHYFEFRSDIGSANTYVYDIATIKANLNRLTATGLPVYITEFDIDEPIDANQLEQYKIYFPIFWSNPGVKGITFWGYIQNDVWTSHPNTYLLRSDGTERPALQWLRTYILSPLTPELISPVGTTGEPRNPLLLWRAAESASSYHLQVAINRTFSSATVDTTVADTLLQLRPLEANTRFYWRVRAENQYGTSDYSMTAAFMTGDQVSAVSGFKGMTVEFNLQQNYPNPFNPTTTISFSLPTRSEIRLVLLNVLGKKVMNIAEGNFATGIHHVQLNASHLAAGIYFYRLEAGNFTATEKLILLK